MTEQAVIITLEVATDSLANKLLLDAAAAIDAFNQATDLELHNPQRQEAIAGAIRSFAAIKDAFLHHAREELASYQQPI